MHPHHFLATLTLALPALVGASVSALGCYAHVPALKDSDQYTFQSQGHCEDKCQKDGYRVAALSSGSTCACSNELPKQSDKVADDQCNVMCDGWPEDKCGGSNAYTVLSMGEYAAGSDSNSTATASSGIIVAPTNINPSSVPTGILTAPGSMVSKASSTASASKSAGSSAAITSATTSTSASASASASPTNNAAEPLRAGSSVLGALVAGLGLLL